MLYGQVFSQLDKHFPSVYIQYIYYMLRPRIVKLNVKYNLSVLLWILWQGWGLTVILGIHTAPELLRIHPMELFDGRKLVGCIFGDFKGKTQLPDLADKCLKGVIRLFTSLLIVYCNEGVYGLIICRVNLIKMWLGRLACVSAGGEHGRFYHSWTALLWNKWSFWLAKLRQVIKMPVTSLKTLLICLGSYVRARRIIEREQLMIEFLCADVCLFYFY